MNSFGVELADLIDKWFKDGTDLNEIVAEMRQAADALEEDDDDEGEG